VADLGPVRSNERMARGAGLFGRLARAQYAALLTMRWRMFVFGLRSIRGILELGASGIELMIFTFVGLGLGIGLGLASHALASHGRWLYLPIEFWVLCLVWQMIPVALASFQDQFDLSGLLRFPVSFGTFFVLYVVFGLADVSTILGVLCCAGIWIGIALVRPEMTAWIALGLAGFAVFNVLLARAILAWVDRWLAQRRTREVASAVLVLFVVSLQLLNPALREGRRGGPGHHEQQTESQHNRAEDAAPWVKAAEAVQLWLPPGLAAGAVQHAAHNQPLPATGSVGLLGLYVLAIGSVLGVRLRAEFRGENLGEAPSRQKAEVPQREWLLNGAGPLSAVLVKELRTLFRSMPQLYALGVPVVMVFVIGSLFRNGGSAMGHSFQMALPVCVAYGLLGFTRIIYNSLGTEGTGIQLLFLFPTPIRTVIMAKNLFHGILYCLVATLSAVLASIRLGTASTVVLASTFAWLTFALPANLAIGNVFSLIMPYRVNPGRITRQPGSQANALLSMLIQTMLLALGAGVVGLCTFVGKLWLTVPILLTMAAIAIFAWWRVLRNLGAMANEHRDELIAKLARAE
jgi:ABC-2 type transport system permease protein